MDATVGGTVSPPSIIDAINQRTMASAEAVAAYSQSHETWPAERTVYDRVAAEVRGRAILDLGVGAGRTVPPLLEFSDDYVGVDYTRAMIEVCRRRFPGVRFENGDARDLSRFRDGSFALVVFSCCGLGMVGHDDRLRILAEVRRVLVPGGVFAFSFHNRASPEYGEGLALPPFTWSKNPARLAVRAARFAVQLARSAKNHRHYRSHEIHEDEYAILNDRCHDHATMLYYITLDKQREQLVRAGFEPRVEAYDLAGKLVTETSRDNAILVLARS
jgi:SAM-dependent methyltransferase